MADGRTDGRIGFNGIGHAIKSEQRKAAEREARVKRMGPPSTWRSSCWSVTAYNDEIAMVEDNTTWPSFIVKVKGGPEKCPKTGKEHYQGCVILGNTQRLSAMKKWLPTAHFEPADKKVALAQYAMKSETAIGEKNEILALGGHDVAEITNTSFKKPHQVLLMLAEMACAISGVYTVSGCVWWCLYDSDNQERPDRGFEALFRHLVAKDITVADFFDPKIKRLWIAFYEEAIKLHISGTAENTSITAVPVDVLGELIEDIE